MCYMYLSMFYIELNGNKLIFLYSSNPGVLDY